MRVQRESDCGAVPLGKDASECGVPEADGEGRRFKMGVGSLCSEDWNTVARVCPSTQSAHEVSTSNTAKAEKSVGMNETHRAHT